MIYANDPYELKFVREHGFFDKSIIIRCVIALFFGLGIFSFLHFREVRMEVLELGAKAPNYISADVNFFFPDEETTAILREESVLDIGPIYAIDPETINKRRLEFETYLIYDQNWRKTAKHSTFDEMYKAMERLDHILRNLRFSDARTITKINELNLKVKDFMELAPFDPSQGVYFPEKVWNSIKNLAFDGQTFQPSTVDFIMVYLNDKIWILREDSSLEKNVKNIVKSDIPLKYTDVPSGSRILDKGEIVTATHLAMLQSMKSALTEKKNLWHAKTILASFTITALIMFVSYLFLKNCYPAILTSNRRLFLLVSIILLGIALAKVGEFILLKTTKNLFELIHYPLLTPLTAILIACLVHPTVAIFAAAIISSILDISLAFDQTGVMLTNLLVSFVVVLSIKSLRKRTEIFIVCAKGWLVACALILALHFYDHSKSSLVLLTDIGFSGIFMLLTAILVVGLLPLFESAFRILTDISLVEYMDPSNELLRRLIIEAPGTYQHELIMGNIAESAALSIGANGLFCRVATLYHDIGKLSIAQYFTENQQPGVNIHQLLTPVESAQVIISHVAEGVQLARKAGLPEQFIDIIKEHHGTGLVYYFYHKQLELVGGNPELVNEKDFRYTGPRPRTKEAVIIMIADSAEAASRSLDEINEASLTKLVNQIVQGKLEDGQFDESLLTFEELAKVKKAIVKSLISIGHLRIKYPTRAPLKGD